MRSSKSIDPSSCLRAVYLSASASIASGSTSGVLVIQREAAMATEIPSFAASEMIFATTSFFAKSLGLGTSALMMSPMSFFWSSSSRILKSGRQPSGPP